ncbi:putative calcium-binding protein CML19 [Platanthera zijinensis]|uniref:Calcium-binding protein CML19 n=1 Tax=Platanthera zijinensis TaxID=2320716 RepID=A0AAP0FUW2_9ASPA
MNSGQPPASKIAGDSLFARIHAAVSPKKSKKPLSPAPAAVPRESTAGREFERVFCYFDEDGDGKISAAELRNCLRAVGEELSPEEAEEVVESSDSDGDGMLEYHDFARLAVADEAEERGRTLRLAFEAYELEGKGCITAASLRQALRRLGEDWGVGDCRNMIKKFDLDGDGVISFDEFELMMG